MSFIKYVSIVLQAPFSPISHVALIVQFCIVQCFLEMCTSGSTAELRITQAEATWPTKPEVSALAQDRKGGMTMLWVASDSAH